MVTIKRLILGFLSNNVFIVNCNGKCFVIDPTKNCERIIEAAEPNTIDAIVCTHYHSDHTGALAELKQKTGACVYASAQDTCYIENPQKVGDSPIPVHAACTVDCQLHDGDTIEVGGVTWQVLLTPGHSQGSLCLYSDKDHGCAAGEVELEGNVLQGQPILFSGDTLFAESTGRTDLLGGNMQDMAASMNRLAKLPDDTLVLPGHNAYTSIGRAREKIFPLWGVN